MSSIDVLVPLLSQSNSGFGAIPLRFVPPEFFTDSDLYLKLLTWLLSQAGQQDGKVFVGVSFQMSGVSLRAIELATPAVCVLCNVPTDGGSNRAADTFGKFMADTRVVKCGLDLCFLALILRRDFGVTMNSIWDFFAHPPAPLAASFKEKGGGKGKNKQGEEGTGEVEKLDKLNLYQQSPTSILAQLLSVPKASLEFDWDKEQWCANQIRTACLGAHVYSTMALNLDPSTPLHSPSQPISPLLQLAHLGDPAGQVWLSRCEKWQQIMESMQKESQQKHQQVLFQSVEVEDGRGGETCLLRVMMSQYTSRIRPPNKNTGMGASRVWVDTPHGRYPCTVVAVRGKQAFLEAKFPPDAPPLKTTDIEGVWVNRADEPDIGLAAFRKYLTQGLSNRDYTPSRVIARPFLALLLDLPITIAAPPPGEEDEVEQDFGLEDLDEDVVMELEANSLRTMAHADDQAPSTMEVEEDEVDMDARRGSVHRLSPLNSSQQAAINMVMSNKVSSVMGPPGTGKTSTIAHLLALMLQASKTDTILCVTETNTAARHLTSSIASALPSQQAMLLVALEYYEDWHEGCYSRLMKGGYLPQFKATGDGKHRTIHSSNLPKTRVLICTVSKAVTLPRDFIQDRTILVIDEASQMAEMSAALLLRRMKSLNKVALFGDRNQLPPFSGQMKPGPTSVLDAFSARNKDTPDPLLPNNIANKNNGEQEVRWTNEGWRLAWRVPEVMLDTQYRMPLHLGSLISWVFYESKLRSHHSSLSKAVEWVNVAGGEEMIGSSKMNRAECDAIKGIWTFEISAGRKPGDIVVISMYEAQRQAVAGLKLPHLTACTVDSFQGQEAPVIILTLASQRITPFLADRNRINVACSRAQEKLYIVGNHDLGLRKDGGPWSSILQYARMEPSAAIALTGTIVTAPPRAKTMGECALTTTTSTPMRDPKPPTTPQTKPPPTSTVNRNSSEAPLVAPLRTPTPNVQNHPAPHTAPNRGSLSTPSGQGPPLQRQTSQRKPSQPKVPGPLSMSELARVLDLEVAEPVITPRKANTKPMAPIFGTGENQNNGAAAPKQVVREPQTANHFPIQDRGNSQSRPPVEQHPPADQGRRPQTPVRQSSGAQPGAGEPARPREVKLVTGKTFSVAPAASPSAKPIQPVKPQQRNSTVTAPAGDPSSSWDNISTFLTADKQAPKAQEQGPRAKEQAPATPSRAGTLLPPARINEEHSLAPRTSGAHPLPRATGNQVSQPKKPPSWDDINKLL